MGKFGHHSGSIRHYLTSLTPQQAICNICLNFMCSFNGDMLPDLLAERASDGKRMIWQAGSDKNFTLKDFPENNNTSKAAAKFRKPHSNAFIDLNQDETAGK